MNFNAIEKQKLNKTQNIIRKFSIYNYNASLIFFSHFIDLRNQGKNEEEECS